MEGFLQPVGIAIATGLVALLSIVAMGAIWSKNQLPVEGKVSREPKDLVLPLALPLERASREVWLHS